MAEGYDRKLWVQALAVIHCINLVGRPESASTLCFAAVAMAGYKKLDVGPLCLRFFALPWRQLPCKVCQRSYGTTH